MSFKPTPASETCRRAQATLFVLSQLPLAIAPNYPTNPLTASSNFTDRLDTIASSSALVLVDYSVVDRSLRFVFTNEAEREKGIRKSVELALGLQASAQTAKEWSPSERLSQHRPVERRFYVPKLDLAASTFDPDALLAHFPRLSQLFSAFCYSVEAKTAGLYVKDDYENVPSPAPRPPGSIFPRPIKPPMAADQSSPSRSASSSSAPSSPLDQALARLKLQQTSTGSPRPSAAASAARGTSARPQPPFLVSVATQTPPPPPSPILISSSTATDRPPPPPVLVDACTQLDADLELQRISALEAEIASRLRVEQEERDSRARTEEAERAARMTKEEDERKARICREEGHYAAYRSKLEQEARDAEERAHSVRDKEERKAASARKVREEEERKAEDARKIREEEERKAEDARQERQEEVRKARDARSERKEEERREEEAYEKRKAEEARAVQAQEGVVSGGHPHRAGFCIRVINPLYNNKRRMVDFLQEKYGEVTALFFQPTLLHGQQWFVARFKNRDEALSVISNINLAKEGIATRWPDHYENAQVLVRMMYDSFKPSDIKPLMDDIATWYGQDPIGVALPPGKGKLVLQMSTPAAAKEIIETGINLIDHRRRPLLFAPCDPYWNFV
ncbi:hypothetical protein NBRC10512_000005 [Rhodotorula toruloides]|uniref:RHTO0S04e07184g1_1 n=2 Tax=Rhodotorula toruloides TaxID=5286 RepID=A0A061AY17_RHOTO|nr:uncharacterized protein RHTO_02065 [Rhodotorula toruloides NP11]EMS21194.1 hypothetical protein RHTO_02065 [Rhodotorula toruloides NP11]CDR39626.1 RHTO0S04e07184g1_1 [Rhodotorula toruloides]